MKDKIYGEYRFSCKRYRMRRKDIMELITSTYWAKNRSWKEMKKSLRYSIPFGAFDARGRQVGLARVLTDFTTTYYLADVVIREDLRGKGIGKAFLAYILSDERFCNIKGILLTGDAHRFYEQFEFVRSGERCMLREYDKKQRKEKLEGGRA